MTGHRPSLGRRWLTLGVVVAMAVSPPVPALAALPGASATDPPPLFASSFEPADPQPAWMSTEGTGSSGARTTSGVDGTSVTGIPGNLADKVIDIKANSENTSAGEVARNLNDGDVNSKWLTFTATGWVQYQLSEP